MNEVNAIASLSPQVPAREIGVVTAEIKQLCEQAQRMALMYAIEIGGRLIEAKSVLPHGQWGEWLKDEVNFSQRTADNFMKLFEEYGAAQISIFGAVSNSQTFANLPYTKALQLLAVPTDEREEFAKEVDVENISVRELQEAIKERNKATEEAAEAKRREEELEAALQEVAKENKRLEELVKQSENAAEKVADMQKRLDAAVADKKHASEKLKEALANPKVPKKTLNSLKKQAELAAKDAANEEVRKALEEAEKHMKGLEADKSAAAMRAKQAEDKLTELQARMKFANPDVAAFKALFESVQESVATLKVKIEIIRKDDHETADKLTAALKAFGASL